MATSTNARRRKANRNATPPASEEAPTRHQRKPSKFKRILRTLLLILIVIAASVGATLYYTWPAGASLLGLNNILNLNTAETVTELDPQAAEPLTHEVEQPVPAPSERPIFSKLEPFTVTVSEGGARSRILHVAITLQLADESSVTLLKEYNPVVRDRALKILSEQHPAHVQTPEGREQLVDALIYALSSPYGGPSTTPRIQNVLFTAFVIQ